MLLYHVKTSSKFILNNKIPTPFHKMRIKPLPFSFRLLLVLLRVDKDDTNK